MLLQDAMERFVREVESRSSTDEGIGAESCLEALARYLADYSDIGPSRFRLEDAPPSDWEEQLAEQMERLLEGDIEPAIDLGRIEVKQCSPNHLREFLGWFLIREYMADAHSIGNCGRILDQWICYLAKSGWISKRDAAEHRRVVRETANDAVRVAKAAHLLFHRTRMGLGVKGRSIGQAFDRFMEGHARLKRVDSSQIMLAFDNHSEVYGPIEVGHEIASLLREGDVLDVELARCSGRWYVVDIGPIYPSLVHLDADVIDPEQDVA